jgi:mono/diheme cytochrome c family protein
MSTRRSLTPRRPALLASGLLAAAGAVFALLPAAEARPAAGAQPRSGAQIYAATCAACHQASGEGTGEAYPPLAGSDWVTGSESRLVRVILHGLHGEIDVEGQTYSGMMPPWAATLNDAEIAAVATYVRSSWGNTAPAVAPATVAQLRAMHASRTTPWTAAELAQLSIPVKK